MNASFRHANRENGARYAANVQIVHQVMPTNVVCLIFERTSMRLVFLHPKCLMLLMLRLLTEFRYASVGPPVWFSRLAHDYVSYHWEPTIRIIRKHHQKYLILQMLCTFGKYNIESISCSIHAIARCSIF